MVYMRGALATATDGAYDGASFTRETTMRALAVLSIGLAAASSAFAQSSEPRVVLKGYDTVAYFTEKRPTKGTPQYKVDWDGGRYYFVNATNRDAFNADPEHYAPQFSGYCAVALSTGKRVEGDPAQWKIVDGKLYVFSAAKGKEMADKDPTLLTRSGQNWQAARK